MYRFEQPPQSFGARDSGLIFVNNAIVAENYVAPPVFNILDNQGAGAGFQAGRCADCGNAGCHAGISKESPGCPFGRDIPDIHKSLEKAGQAEEAAIKALEKATPGVLEQLKERLALANENAVKSEGSNLPDANTVFPDWVFDELKKVNQRLGDGYERLFKKHMKDAFLRSYEKGPMGDIFGRICPTSLCERSCTTEQSRHGAVTIKKNEAAVWDYAWASGWLDKIEPKHKHNQTALIVGSGFAGFAIAERLREEGYKVVMVEKNEQPGEPGNNQILQYKTLHERFNRHYDRLRNSGVEIVTNMKVGEGGTSLRALKERYNANAIFLAVGTPKSKTARIDGDAKDKVIDWATQTGAQQTADRTHGERPVPVEINACGKIVVINGTGDTAVDVARVAIAQGAKEIIFVSRHDKIKAESEDAAAYKTMVKNAAELGVKFTVQNWMTVNNVSYDAQGGLIIAGNNNNAARSQSKVQLHADLIINAVGSEPGDLKKTFGISNMITRPKSTINVLTTPARHAEKDPVQGVGSGFVGILDNAFVFAAGECVRGSSLASTCSSDGINIQKFAREALENPEAFHKEAKARSGNNPALVLNVA